MADHAVDDFDGDIFIYRGGRAPQHVTHVLIDGSVDKIEVEAFRNCEDLEQVETHDGIRRIGKKAFWGCESLRCINLKSVVEIDEFAFYSCENLESVVFGDGLATIGKFAYNFCTSLSILKLPSITAIGMGAFGNCIRLTDVEFSEGLETIERIACRYCDRLRRIAIPLKRDLFVFSDAEQKYNQFDDCDQLTTVDLVGQAHKQTVASLHMESWRTEIIAEIIRINQALPNTLTSERTNVIRQWMDSVIDKLDHYKSEHCRYVREGITILELALWKAKLDEKEVYAEEGKPKKAKIDADIARKDKRMTCGADIVINNVLPFLQLLE